jgi:hypothetical protein
MAADGGSGGSLVELVTSKDETDTDSEKERAEGGFGELNFGLVTISRLGSTKIRYISGPSARSSSVFPFLSFTSGEALNYSISSTDVKFL